MNSTFHSYSNQKLRQDLTGNIFTNATKLNDKKDQQKLRLQNGVFKSDTEQSEDESSDHSRHLMASQRKRISYEEIDDDREHGADFYRRIDNTNKFGKHNGIDFEEVSSDSEEKSDTKLEANSNDEIQDKLKSLGKPEDSDSECEENLQNSDNYIQNDKNFMQNNFIDQNSENNHIINTSQTDPKNTYKFGKTKKKKKESILNDQIRK